MRLSIWLAITLLASAPCSRVSATDFLCRELPLAHDPGLTRELSPLIDSNPAPRQMVPLVDEADRVALGSPLQRTVPLQQVDTSKAIRQALATDGNLVFSDAEKLRQEQSAACGSAYRKLLKTFVDVRKAISYPESVEDSAALAEFVGWYISPTTTPAQKALAQPVVDAQREYGTACLSKDIPAELSSLWIERSVGILSADKQPICGGLRQHDAFVITAQHCFRDPDGTLYPYTRAASEGSAHIWFTYEAEPTHRYEVCRSSLPRDNNRPFRTYADNIRLTIAKPQIAAPQWNWATLPLRPGSSLYLRGYFHFAPELTDLERMRATSAGGCTLLAAKDRCLFHACQSTQMMSGSPVFVRPDSGNGRNMLEVVGLHLGGAAIANKTAAAPGACEGSVGSTLDLSNFAYQPTGY